MAATTHRPTRIIRKKRRALLSRYDEDDLHRLRVELRVLLVQLVVHKQVTVKRLQRLSGLPEAELEADLGALTRMSLVRRDERDVLHVDRFVAHLVTARLRAQGMLA